MAIFLGKQYSEKRDGFPEETDSENINNTILNITKHNKKYTRIIEHKHFENSLCKGTVITKEYPVEFNKDNELFYPINDDKNNEIYLKYEALSNKYNNDVTFLKIKGVLMNKEIIEKIEKVKKEINNTSNLKKKKELTKHLHRLQKELNFYKINMKKYKANN